MLHLKHAAPEFLRRAYWRYLHRRETQRQHSAKVGWFAAMVLNWSRWIPSRVCTVHIKGYEHPIAFRPRTSDAAVIREIFSREQYEPVSRLTDVRLIIDCGGNIGCASLYLLSRYPEAQAVVIEPDADNMRICQRNLAGFRGRVKMLKAGVWSSNVPLRVLRGTYRNADECSHQVVPCKPGESEDTYGVTLESILDTSGFETIDLLKIDVEAAERELFREPSQCSRWLARTRVIAIELHDDDCVQAFNACLDPSTWARFSCGEVTVCNRLT